MLRTNVMLCYVNITNNPEHMNDNDSNEPDVFHTIVTPNSRRDERQWKSRKNPLSKVSVLCH